MNKAIIKLIIEFIFKWVILSIIVGIIIGSVSALFLIVLDWATDFRENNFNIIYFLPITGLLIGFSYHYFGKNVSKGNKLLLEELLSPQKKISFKMAPMIFLSTILTHIFGGSAGREGTAVQMGGSIADQFSQFLKLDKNDRRILIIIGISGGFASVFGTPIAGAIFALEVVSLKKIKYNAIFPSFLTALISDYICLFWNVTHTQYFISFIPPLNFQYIIISVFCGIIYGLTALLFTKSLHFWSKLFNSMIKYPPLRPFFGGFVIIIGILFLGTNYIGLGIPTIVNSFREFQNPEDFIIKILFTTFTLGAGFKGGEVTPLFFIGATLGNVLGIFLPIPFPLLAGMGFVAVFAGASKTPIACTFMAIELFGIQSVIYMAIACFTAYYFSGKEGIYTL